MLLVGRVGVERRAGRIGPYVAAQRLEGRGHYCGTGIALCWKQEAAHAAYSDTELTSNLTIVPLGQYERLGGKGYITPSKHR